MPETKIDEVDILNFALNLEYLEAESYTYATTGESIASFGIGTKGTANGDNPANGGTTKGGTKVSFSQEEAILHDIATQIGADERAHVVLLRAALGSSAVAMPNIDLSALGFGFGSPERFPPGSTHSRGHRCDRILGRRRYAQDSRHHCGRGWPSGGGGGTRGGDTDTLHGLR